MSKINKGIQIAISSILTCGVIVVNILAFYYAGLISNQIDGDSTSISSPEVFEEILDQSDDLCSKIVEEGAVLLRNENNCLPLKDTTKINVFGWRSIDNAFYLTGIGEGLTNNTSNFLYLLDALNEGGFETNQELSKFYKDYDSTKNNYTTQNNTSMALTEPNLSSYGEDILNNAKEFSDVAIFVLGRDCGDVSGGIPHYQKKGHLQGTDFSRSYLELSTEEEEVISYLKNNFSKVIVLINSSNSLEIGKLETIGVDAILDIGLPGQSGVRAIPKLLKGEISPSGRLTDTYAYDYTLEPAYNNLKEENSNIIYKEDIYYGYKWYETADYEGYFDDVDNEYGKGYDGVVTYPFGYGLSYTSFYWEVTNVSKTSGSLDSYSKIRYTLKCKNMGDYEGQDTIQLYATLPYIDGEIEKPYKVLLDFKKTSSLKPGEEEDGIVLEFSAKDLASYDAYDKNNNEFCGYELDEGDYEITLNENVHTLKEVSNSSQNSYKYSVPTGGIKFSTDEKTGNDIENRFTGDDAYASTPIDGSTAFEDLTYLSRSDFKSTFPQKKSETINTEAIEAANNYVYDSYNITSMPSVGMENTLFLKTNSDGSKASYQDLRTNSSDTVYNSELIETIAQNYDCEELETLVSQMTTSELAHFVEDAGFGIDAFASIGKPRTIDYDGPMGLNTYKLTLLSTDSWTLFPSQTVLARTMNVELAKKYGQSIGLEAQSSGISGWYSPKVNLHRSSYYGQNYRTYSEDGILTGKIASSIINGLNNYGIYAYVGSLGLKESGEDLDEVNVWVTEQNYRENYLKPFEIIIKNTESCGIMTGYNSIGGVWSGACYAQNNEILRNERGFKGPIITDTTFGTNNMGTNPGLKGGTDLWKNSNNNRLENPIDKTSYTMIYLAKKAVKNYIYMYCKAYYEGVNFEPSDDDIKIEIGTTVHKEIYPWWILIVAFIDIGTISGFIAWILYSFVKPKLKM